MQSQIFRGNLNDLAARHHTQAIPSRIYSGIPGLSQLRHPRGTYEGEGLDPCLFLIVIADGHDDQTA
jgi:hypothetical protein